MTDGRRVLVLVAVLGMACPKHERAPSANSTAAERAWIRVEVGAHTAPIAALAVSEQEPFVATAGLDGTLRLWSTRDLSPIAVIDLPLQAHEATDYQYTLAAGHGLALHYVAEGSELQDRALTYECRWGTRSQTTRCTMGPTLPDLVEAGERLEKLELLDQGALAALLTRAPTAEEGSKGAGSTWSWLVRGPEGEERIGLPNLSRREQTDISEGGRVVALTRSMLEEEGRAPTEHWAASTWDEGVFQPQLWPDLMFPSPDQQGYDVAISSNGAWTAAGAPGLLLCDIANQRCYSPFWSEREACGSPERLLQLGPASAWWVQGQSLCGADFEKQALSVRTIPILSGDVGGALHVEPGGSAFWAVGGELFGLSQAGEPMRSSSTHSAFERADVQAVEPVRAGREPPRCGPLCVNPRGDLIGFGAQEIHLVDASSPVVPLASAGLEGPRPHPSAADGRELWRDHQPGDLRAVVLSGDLRFALTLGEDSTVRWFRTDSGALVLSLYVLDDGRWVAWNPEAEYLTSPGAEDLVRRVVDQGPDRDPLVQSAAEIHDRYWREDLFSRVF